MGGHYGSIQVRTLDRAAVKTAAEQVARQRSIRCLLGPEINGWVGIYPEGHGQDDTVSRDIAQMLDADVLHLMVHDDAVLAYWLWRKHELVDSYWSKPGYFGEENREDEEKRTGDPEQFRAIIGINVVKLNRILRRERVLPVEADRLDEFAKRLGISNVVTAYEYLNEEDHVGVKSWRKFVEVPGGRREKEKHARKKNLQTAATARKRQIKDGFLLFSESRKTHGWLTASVNRDEFLVHWGGFVADPTKPSLLAFRPPWSQPNAVSIETKGPFHALVADKDGVTIGLMTPGSVTLIRQGDASWKMVNSIALPDQAVQTALSPSGDRVAFLGRERLIVEDVSTGQTVEGIDEALKGVHRIQFHPAGNHVVMSGPTLNVFDVRSLTWRELYGGGKNAGSARLAAMQNAQHRHINIEAMLEIQRAGITGAIARFGSVKQKSAGIFKAIEEMSSTMEAQIEKERSRLTAVKEGQVRTPIQPNEAIHCFSFSHDGRWMICSIDRGLRVYEWDSVLNTLDDAMPREVWRYDPRPILGDAFATSGVTAFAPEWNDDGIVFAAGAAIYRFDLATGEVNKLVTLHSPGAASILLLTPDDKTLGVSWMTSPGKSRQKTYWEIWSYAQLRNSTVTT